MSASPDVERTCVVIPVTDLAAAIDQFGRLGFRLDRIGPADRPVYAEISDGTTGLRLETVDQAGASTPFLRVAERRDRPIAVADPDAVRPQSDHRPWHYQPAVVVVTGAAEGGASGLDDGVEPPAEGRAGMAYRDLIPGRLGGALIASHIRIADGGPVPDYVHHHDIDFQLIYCHRGWVDVVYQDQGDPIRLQAGDCLLQPPGIRHRVLTASDNLQVLEVSSPAEHVTHVEHDLALPNGSRPGLTYGDQRFVVHRQAGAAPDANPVTGVDVFDFGLGPATKGRVSAASIRATEAAELPLPPRDDIDQRFLFVAAGSAALIPDQPVEVDPGRRAVSVDLATDGAVTIPASVGGRLRLSAGADVVAIEARFGS